MFLKEAIILFLVAFLLAYNTSHTHTTPIIVQRGDNMDNKPSITRDVTTRSGRRYHLPFATGPFPNIGHIDLMTGTAQNDGVLVRILYPSSNQTVNPKDNSQQWPNWYPSKEYKTGYLNSVNVTSSALIKLNDLFQYDVYIPTVENTDPLRLDSQTFPVIIFSHGLSSCRTTYSNVGYELASYGFIVFDIEHRDGSACTTFYPNENGTEPFKWIPFKHKNEFPDEFVGRTQQLEVRLAEIRRLIDLINDLQNGKPVKNVLKTQINSQKFVGLFDLNKVIAMGHSFGSATAIKAAEKIETIKLGICLDSWMFALKGVDINSIKKPILFINMETFQWSLNLREMKKYIPNGGKNSDQRRVYTIKEAKHSDPSDLPFVMSYIAKRITGMFSKVDPFLVHDVCTALSLQFIEDILKIKLKKDKNGFIDKYRNQLKEGLEEVV